MSDFSYQFYIDLIKVLRAQLPLLDFSEVTKDCERFFLLRHDVEFSVEKAYDMALIEHEQLGIHASYFFQVRNYSYNPFSFKNSRLINRIHDMGHKIGLHVNSSGLTIYDDFVHFIKNDVGLLHYGTGVPVDRFSFHRPSLSLLKAGIKIEGLLNTYDALYFQLYEHTPSHKLSRYYFSDSEHRWKYGNPLEQLNPDMKKIQLLIHPYSWSKKGLNNEENFKELIHLKYLWMLQSMQSECHNFPEGLMPNDKL
jgi:hypothetical protein